MVRKSFFSEPTKAHITRKDFVKIDSLRDILSLDDNAYTVIRPLVPRGFDSWKKFLKHGSEVRPRRLGSLRRAVEMARTPVQRREEAFERVHNGRRQEYCGYSFMPLGGDERKRKVSLYECLEGARLFAYAHQTEGEKITIQAYADAQRVRRDGASVIATVPSRTEEISDHQFKLFSVPFVDSAEKYKIAEGIGSDHSCGSKRFNIRYRYSDDKEGSGIVTICAHEIAGYLALIQREWEEHKNMVPLQMSQFAIPSQKTVDYYLKFERNVLVHDEDVSSKDRLRKPHLGEMEIGLWNFVRTYGHDDTFFSLESRDGPVRMYQWE